MSFKKIHIIILFKIKNKSFRLLDPLINDHLCTFGYIVLYTHIYRSSYLYTLMRTSEKAMAPHSSTLAWKIPWTEEPGRLQSMGSRRVGHDWATSLSLFTFMYWRRKWQPTPVFLPGESQGWGASGLPSMGSHRVRHDWSDIAAAAMKT